MRRDNTILQSAFAKPILPEKRVSQMIQFQCVGHQTGYLPFDGLDIGPIPPTPKSRLCLNTPDDMRACH